MKKRAKNTGKMMVRNKLDTVGVAGSIPVEPTILKLPNNTQAVEIPDGFKVVPAVEWNDGLPRFYRVLTRNSGKRCERGVNGRGAAFCPICGRNPFCTHSRAA